MKHIFLKTNTKRQLRIPMNTWEGEKEGLQNKVNTLYNKSEKYDYQKWRGFSTIVKYSGTGNFMRLVSLFNATSQNGLVSKGWSQK